MKALPLFLPALLLAVSVFADERRDGLRETFGPRFRANESAQRKHGPKQGLDALHRWNEIAINAAGLDHTPVAPGETRVFGEQLGPCRSSRALAIVHIAICDSVNAVLGGCESFTNVRAARVIAT